MYCAGPDMDIQLNLDDAKHFVDTVDWDKICGWGFYGGEPSIDIELYQQFYELLPLPNKVSDFVPKFIITNGSWSKSEYDTGRFLRWCRDKFDIYISSGTDEHRAQQDPDVIRTLSQHEGIHVRYEDEELIPMGRNFKSSMKFQSPCTEKCLWHKQPVRLGLFPTGDVVLQNCDGAYPVVSHIKEGFTVAFDRAVQIREKGLRECVWLHDLNFVMKGME